jgi:hypothetical protein
LEYEKLLKLLGEDGKFDLVLWNGRWWPYRFSFPGQAVLQERDKVSAYILSLKVCFE